MRQFSLNKLFVFLIAPALLLSFTTTPDRVNLSGEWKLNEGKSELGNFGRFTPRKIKIEQKDASISISKTTVFNDNENTTTESLTFDGKESESTGFAGSKKKSTAKWSDDGQTLTISFNILFERDGQSTEFKGTETWSLKDGMLSLVTVSTSPRGENTTKAIFEK